MTETESLGFHIPIIHPDELDRMLQSEEFSGRVAGVTTTSIDSVRRLISDPGRSLQTHADGSINLDLVADVYNELFGEETHFRFSASETIQNNIDAFGHGQAVKGLLSERGASPEAIRVLTTLNSFEYVTKKALKDLTDEEIDTKFSDHKRIGYYIKEVYPYKDEDTRVIGDILKAIFPRGRRFAGFLKDLRSRNGVQVIFGDRPKFIDFATKHNHENVDDAGITLHTDIPRGLILGIVPRGRFEQQELLAA